MKKSKTFLFRFVFLWLSLWLSLAAQAQSTVPTSQGWPRTVLSNDVKVEIFQPQLDNWNNLDLDAHAAIAATFSGDKEPTYGVLSVSASTLVDRVSRTVRLDKIKRFDVRFPSAPEREAPFAQAMENVLLQNVEDIPLDNIEAALAISQARHKGLTAPLKNTPPKIIISQTPALLVYIDGAPRWTKIDGTAGLERVLNTRVLLLRDAQSKLYLHFLDGYLIADNLQGPWQIGSAPAGARAAEDAVKENKQTDLLVGQPDKEGGKLPSLKTLPGGKAPQVYIETAPAELIVFDGRPDYVPLDGTDLLYAKNTTANIFKDMKNQKTYVLLAGRWFAAPDLNGPWTYVEPKTLPADFAKIPDASDKENVKASVPGTQQAREAIVANEIPQTAIIERQSTTFKAVIDGTAELRPIDGTSLQYVINAADPIIRVDSNHWYALHNAVWFTAASPFGPWVVATAVPTVIYSIPPSSPLYYVTYVKIYEVTPTTVVIGYTPGYYGTIVTADGVVVYGTGYAYTPWVGTYWYGPPVTYGIGVNICWTPWGGWAFGFGFGWAWGYADYGWWYPPAPWWGPYWGGAYYNDYGGISAWGPGGWAGTTGNIYQRWGNVQTVQRGVEGYNAFTGNQFAGRYGTAYNSHTGAIAVGHQGAVENVYTGNYAAGGAAAGYDPSRGVAAAGRRTTVGNEDGRSVTSTHADVYNKNTGRNTSVGRISGNEGNSVTRINDNLYGSRDGQVYRYDSGTGQWQPMVKGDSRGVDGGRDLGGETRQAPERQSLGQNGGGVQRQPLSQDRIDSLNRERESRDLGSRRDSAFQNHGAQFQRGGGAGGFRGGGGFRLRR